MTINLHDILHLIPASSTLKEQYRIGHLIRRRPGLLIPGPDIKKGLGKTKLPFHGENGKLKSLEPFTGGQKPARERLRLRDEFILAFFPTVTVLIVLLFVETLTRQRFLFATLAASAFLIYLDPEHGTNQIRTLVISQIGAAVLGLVTYLIFGPGYASGASAMMATIVFMILSDVVHPPAVSTSLVFAFRAGDETNLLLFSLAVGVTAILVILERGALWILTLHNRRKR